MSALDDEYAEREKCRAAFRNFITGNDMFFSTSHAPINRWDAEALFLDIVARNVAQTTIYTNVGEVRIATSFTVFALGVFDHEPILYETAVFSDVFSNAQGIKIIERYTSAREASRGHYRTVPFTVNGFREAGAEILTFDTARGPLFNGPRWEVRPGVFRQA